MIGRATRYGFTLRLDAGDEIVASLAAVAERHDLRAGLVSGLGAARDIERGPGRDAGPALDGP
jgi:predicted DNA-binding protein with PD1-like motif